MKDCSKGEGNWITIKPLTEPKSSKTIDDELPTVYHWGDAWYEVLDSTKSSEPLFWDQNVTFLTSNKGNARWYWLNVYEWKANIKKPFVFDAKEKSWRELDVWDDIKKEYNNLIVDKYKNFENKWTKRWDEKIGDNLKELNNELSFFGYAARPSKSSPWYFDIIDIRHWRFRGDIKQYAISDIWELFSEWDMWEYIWPKEWFNTDDLVRYVLHKNEQGANYDWIIIKNVVDSTNMAAASADDFVIFNSDQFIKKNAWQ